MADDSGLAMIVDPNSLMVLYVLKVCVGARVCGGQLISFLLLAPRSAPAIILYQFTVRGVGGIYRSRTRQLKEALRVTVIKVQHVPP